MNNLQIYLPDQEKINICLGIANIVISHAMWNGYTVMDATRSVCLSFAVLGAIFTLVDLTEYHANLQLLARATIDRQKEYIQHMLIPFAQASIKNNILLCLVSLLTFTILKIS